MNTFDICYSLDSSYLEQLEASVASILKNAYVQDNINFYILDGGLTEEDKYEIELLRNIKTFNIKYIPINKEDFINCPLLKEQGENNKDYHVTLPTYFRFKLAELLPNLDRILYLDCDVLVRSSFSELFKIDLKNSAAAMILDAESKQEAARLKIKKYFNAGVMLINLAYWRKNNVEEKLFNYAQNNKDSILWQDQDIINVVLNGRIKELPIVWNFQYFLYEEVDNAILSECKILHLAGRFKPWLMPFEHNIYDYYYYYLALTSKKNKILEYKQNASGKFLKNNVGGRTTNILVNATNEDVQKVYDEVSKVYDYAKEQLDLGNKNTDVKLLDVYKNLENSYDFTKKTILEIKTELEQNSDVKISKIYEEISKNYDFVKETISETEFSMNTSINEKVSELYDSITKAFDFTKETAAETEFYIKNDIDVRISKVYDEINNNYEFTKELSNELKYKTELSTDDKLSKVYEEITRNYKYTEELVDKVNETVETSKNEVNVKIEDIKQNIDEKLSAEKISLTSETDSKIENVYNEITKNYEYTNKQSEDLKTEMYSLTMSTETTINQRIEENKKENETKVSEIYNAISSTHEFAKEIAEEKELSVKKHIDEKLSHVYENITKNYEYTNTITEETNRNINERITNQTIDITKETDEKLSKVYDEITKNYEYTNELSEKIKNQNLQITDELRNQTNSKINEIQNEITYVKTNSEELVNRNKEIILNQLSDNAAEINKNISNLKEDVFNNINNQIIDTIHQTDSKITKVYEEITKNYEYTNKLNEDNKNEILSVKQYSDNLAEKINNEVINQNSVNSDLLVNIQQTNEKVNEYKQECLSKITDVQTQTIQQLERVQDEIAKNASFTEFLVQSVEEKQNQQRIDTLNQVNESINNLRNEFNDKLNYAVNDINNTASAKYNEIENYINTKVYNLSQQINKETNIKFSEIYSYANEQISNLYKEVKNTSLMIENTLNTQIWDLYKKNNELNNEINYLREKLSQRPDENTVKSLILDIKQDSDNKEREYNQNIVMLKNEFTEELNNQRVKYETKLVNMENQIEQMNSVINELQKNSFIKLIDKMKKSKKDN